MHQTQIDHKAALTHRVTRHAMTTAPNRRRQPDPACELDRCRDVVATRAARDYRRPTIRQGIEGGAGDVVTRIFRSQYRAPHRPPQPLDR
jgi:hypothetical protein